ncbi:MAG TPA: 30S ribosomal protein S12 methylthiotransferase RimO [Bacillota bacterium]|nr:30S ribosomal protein S12 methylthiotransferase RimO [Bacillota bacterium]
MEKVKIAFASLGCAKNQVDSEVMMGLLEQAGYQLTDNPSEAQVLVVNTCGFIDDAKEESIAQILEFAALKEEGQAHALVVTGCLSQRYPKELAEELPEVDCFLGVNEVPQIVQVVEGLLAGKKVQAQAAGPYLYTGQEPRRLITPPGTAIVKLAEGCNNCCTYCAIPSIRGPYRSRPLEQILSEAQRLAKEGARELLLVAQDTSFYGTDLYGKSQLPELLRQLDKISELVWIRPLYFYPTRITTELLEAIASTDKVCKYIDLPLQHASKKVLAQMGRGGTAEGLLEKIATIRAAIPNVTLRSTFIVGFPGEEDEDFQELMSFIEAAQLERVGVFPYSREDGTVAANLASQVPRELALERAEELMRLQRSISRRKNQQRVGSEVLVMSEGAGEEGGSIVRSEAEAPEVDGVIFLKEKLPAGHFATARITEAYDYDLAAHLV